GPQGPRGALFNLGLWVRRLFGTPSSALRDRALSTTSRSSYAKTTVALTRSLCCHLQRDRVEPLFVALGVTPDERLYLCRCRHRCPWRKKHIASPVRRTFSSVTRSHAGITQRPLGAVNRTGIVGERVR